MKKVYVVTKSVSHNNNVVIGVFSVEDKAIAYCDHIDPAELDYCVDDYEIDALIESEDRLAAPNE